MTIRTGFYICHCGINIAGKVRVTDVADFVRKLRGVVVSRDYRFMCSDPGQAMIEKDIREYGLNRVVVASCSPRLHEKTFQSACRRAGLNPYLFQMASVREQVSWVTLDEDEATQKAKSLAAAAVSRVVFHNALDSREVKVHPDVLVVGAGIAGMQAALDIAAGDHHVYLIEKSGTIGGHMLQFDKTFPTLDCAACIGTPKMVDVAQHPNITLMTCSEVTELTGYIGNYTAKVHRYPRYVKEGVCTGCGECAGVCPVSFSSEWDEGLGRRKAIFRAFPQAVPITFRIDKKDRAPCVGACPAHANVQGYVQLIKQRKYTEAVRLIMERIPLPGVLGRVCPHPCELKCRRAEVDASIAIRDLKRFAADQVNFETLALPDIQEKDQKIAVIGSGPAGLTVAFDLRRKGYQVVIFEALPQLGGLLRFISSKKIKKRSRDAEAFSESGDVSSDPDSDYRLPASVLDAEIGYILRMGVKTVCNVRFGTDITLTSLKCDGYAAVFLGVGARACRKLGVPAKDTPEGNSETARFLRDIGMNASGSAFGFLECTSQSTIRVHPDTLQTSIPHVFAGGDAVSGPATVVGAVAAGHRAAEAIDRFVQGVSLDGMTSTGPDVVVERRTGCFDEIPVRFSEEEALRETQRCLNCGGCCECMECVRACAAKAIDHAMTGEDMEVQVGAVILATGFDVMDPTPLTQFGYGVFPNVFTNLEFERISNATGPTGGKIWMRNAAGEFTGPPESVAILHCIGSRDVHCHEYCSRVCCMAALKYSHLIKEKVGHHVPVYDFYIDMRCFGEGYEEFYRRCQEEGTHFVRGKVAEISDQAITPEEKGKLIAIAEDTLLGKRIRVPVDMVVLCSAIEARKDAMQVGRVFGVNLGADGFFLEEHPKLGPLNTATDGVFIAGACQSPKDIPDTVAQASGAAAKALSLASRGRVTVQSVVSWINPDICAGCMLCIPLCPYSAIEFDFRRNVSVVNEAVCKGCGSCSGVCPSGAAQVRHFKKQQVFAEFDGMMDAIIEIAGSSGEIQKDRRSGG